MKTVNDMPRRRGLAPALLAIVMAFLLTACSTTRGIPDDDQLFTGLKPISYVDDDKSLQTATMKEEVEAALATAPNGALFGSSYYRSPLPIGLWVWNAYSHKKGRLAHWLTKSFGTPPVLMSQVNPALRASVARSVLRNNGYFRGDVTYAAVPQKNPKKSKIRYTVRLDSLFTIDSLDYAGFSGYARQLIDSTLEQSELKAGDAFSLAELESERNRLTTLLRNNGFYYYKAGYASYLADTLASEGRVRARLQLAGELPPEALRQWYVGNINVQLRRSTRELLTDSLKRRHLLIKYNGDKSPIRPRTVLRGLRLRPRQAYSYAAEQESASRINATGVFSSVDFQFTPRDQDTLDLTVNCVFDKPYDLYMETNVLGRTIGRYGPELKLGFTKRNAFRGAEKLDVNLHGSYEWQRSGSGGSGADMNTYQYGLDASLEFPRIIAPFYNSERVSRNRRNASRMRRRNYTPTTLAKISSDIVRRPGYYKMHIVSGEWSYRWQTSSKSRHEFSPFTLTYQYMNSHTEKFDSILLNNPYLSATMDNYFIPKMRYTYTYTSPASRRHPLRWETTVEEAGNVVALYDRLNGRSWNERNKTLFKNPYAQFVRLETDLTKTWALGHSRYLVGHVTAGAIRSFGNSSLNDTPFSELFYAGGANSIRAFTVRSVGPGSFRGLTGNKQFNYILQNGDLKLVANLEYRTPLWGNLHGAVFLDAGNVWRWKDIQFDASEEEDDGVRILLEAFNTWLSGTAFSTSSVLDQVALGTGVGLRYDMGFLVFRLDWGLALHAPYDTGRSGYFNINRFRDAHSLHLAIGYPF